MDDTSGVVQGDTTETPQWVNFKIKSRWGGIGVYGTGVKNRRASEIVKAGPESRSGNRGQRAARRL